MIRYEGDVRCQHSFDDRAMFARCLVCLKRDQAGHAQRDDQERR